MYKPIKWENKPVETNIKANEICFGDSVVIVDNNEDYLDAVEHDDRIVLYKPKIRPESYICKNCNGHINPKTLKCEYCDTQY